jgi:hypothetical protein
MCTPCILPVNYRIDGGNNIMVGPFRTSQKLTKMNKKMTFAAKLIGGISRTI